MSRAQGAQATWNGRRLEELIVTVLMAKGYPVLAYREWRRAGQPRPCLVRDVPYTTIYGHRGRTEFVLFAPWRPRGLRIECKWQELSGSVDEKVPYMYLNAVEAMPEPAVAFVVGGSGAKAGAKRWIRQAAAERRYHPVRRPRSARTAVRVYEPAEFLTWLDAHVPRLRRQRGVAGR